MTSTIRPLGHSVSRETLTTSVAGPAPGADTARTSVADIDISPTAAATRRRLLVAVDDGEHRFVFFRVKRLAVIVIGGGEHLCDLRCRRRFIPINSTIDVAIHPLEGLDRAARHEEDAEKSHQKNVAHEITRCDRMHRIRGRLPATPTRCCIRASEGMDWNLKKASILRLRRSRFRCPPIPAQWPGVSELRGLCAARCSDRIRGSDQFTRNPCGGFDHRADPAHSTASHTEIIAIRRYRWRHATHAAAVALREQAMQRQCAITSCGRRVQASIGRACAECLVCAIREVRLADRLILGRVPTPGDADRRGRLRPQAEQQEHHHPTRAVHRHAESMRHGWGNVERLMPRNTPTNPIS